MSKCKLCNKNDADKVWCEFNGTLWYVHEDCQSELRHLLNSILTLESEGGRVVPEPEEGSTNK